MASQKPGLGSNSRLPPTSQLPRSQPITKLPARKPSSNAALPAPTLSPAKPGVLRKKAIAPSNVGAKPQIPKYAPARQDPPKQPVYTKSAMKQPEKNPRFDAQQHVDTLPPPNRIPLLPPSRTPSLVSGSSGSTGDSPRSHILRRKPSFGRAVGARVSPDSSSSSEEPPVSLQTAFAYADGYDDAAFGISLGQTIAPTLPHKSPIINLDEYVAHPSLITADLPPPPTPLYAMTTTPSTGYSPGPFSISSTPTSATCYSPALGTAGTPRSYLAQPRQTSPVKTRPPNSRHTTAESTTTTTTTSSGGLPARQSSTSSGSTVRASEGGKFEKPASGFPSKSIKNTTMSSKVITSPRMISPTNRVAPMSKGMPKKNPPELAYLSNALGPSSISPRPARPSRDGTPDMNFNQTSPVIQSNMSSLPVTHKRQSSSESKRVLSPVMTSLETNKPRFGLPRKSTSRNPSPSPTSGTGGSVTSLPRGVTPEPKDSDKLRKSQPSPQSRFGFFKRGKNDSQTSLAQKEKRLKKPPPVAGTGHEAYSKFSIRGRSGSNTSGVTVMSADRRSSSTDSAQRTGPSSRKNSLGSRRTSGVDEFVTDRLNPITLRGNGTIQSGNAGISDNAERPIVEIRPGTAPAISRNQMTGLGPIPPLRPVYDNRNMSATDVKTNSSTSVDSKSSRFGLTSLSPRRTNRRSMIESKSSSISSTDLGEDFHFPSHPAINPLMERKMSEPNPVIQRPSMEVSQSKSVEPVPTTSPKPKKWNFFQRSKTPIRKADTPVESMQAAVPVPLPPRSLPHYAMMDAPSKIDMDELEAIMQEAEDGSPDEAAPQQEEEEDDEDGKGLLKEPSKSRHGNSILLPAPPQLLPEFAMPARPESPRVVLQPAPVEQPQRESPSPPAILPPFQFRPGENGSVDEPEPPIGLAALPKGSRLPQVGRIPRVVSRRDRQKKPSISSFSRPFDATLPSPALQTGSFSEEQSSVLYPSQAPSPLSAMEHAQNHYGNLHHAASSIHSQWSAEEVWNEYDDLLDLLSPAPRSPKTPHTGSSFGAPFHYTQLASPAQEIYASLPLPPTEVPSVPSIIRRVRFPSTRESQIFAAAGSNVLVTTPTSPYFIADMQHGNAERNSSVRVSLPSIRFSSGTRLSLPASIRSTSGVQTNSETLATKGSKRESLNIQVAEAQHMGFETMANLRFSALMTSKWLSFGRVLLSDAHFNLNGSTTEARVLVLDGLGKALTYPNATIYNLGTDPPEDSSRQTGGMFKPLPNHRHIYQPDNTSPFPFPKGFFSAVVLRFPVVASESSYKFTLAECKRVLRPGGYLEVSVLDMDMLNMGNRGRRALRALKERIHAEDSTVSLKPISDTMQRLIGRRGFENMNRCVVGVPAAGCIPSSKDGSPSQLASPAQGSPVKETFGESNLNLNGLGVSRSIADLLRDKDNVNNPPPPVSFSQDSNINGQDDAGVTRMVARVARWWHSRCYESMRLATGDVAGSIWSDTELLSECESRGSTLRLMVCVAQKPECTVRRTISV